MYSGSSSAAGGSARRRQDQARAQATNGGLQQPDVVAGEDEGSPELVEGESERRGLDGAGLADQIPVDPVEAIRVGNGGSVVVRSQLGGAGSTGAELVGGSPGFYEPDDGAGVAGGVVVGEAEAEAVAREKGDLQGEGRDDDLVFRSGRRRELRDEGIELVGEAGVVAGEVIEVGVALGDGEGDGVAGGEADGGTAGVVEGVDDFSGEGEEAGEGVGEGTAEFGDEGLEESGLGAGGVEEEEALDAVEVKPSYVEVDEGKGHIRCRRSFRRRVDFEEVEDGGGRRGLCHGEMFDGKI
ncbi:disease resistance protein [Striga asiatica]|uniref:Disease resistance protein n=1 Tax=Striga asiatica TaxID=4170 RepID=A0A5A7PFU0_STRAF|nr:disease resistance protein [Striga asiatica]